MTTFEAVQGDAPIGPFSLAGPQGDPLPLVCDSPHSGVFYPDDFRAVVPLARLRGGEDTHIDTLWEAVPKVGGTLVAATFPRVYIDPNRMLDDLDPDLLDGPWPTTLARARRRASATGWSGAGWMRIPRSMTASCP